MDVAASFNVEIRNIACTSLPAFSAGRTPNVFVKLNFDNFKQFSTPPRPKEVSPAWPQEVFAFNYTTRYADCLHRKALILEVFDRNRFSANELLGTCRVDLHTVASGAVSHTLPLREGKRVKGSISFDVVMQQVSEVHMQLSALHPHGIAPNYPLKGGLALELSLGACPATTKAGPQSLASGAGELDWTPQAPLQLEGSVAELMSAVVDVRLLRHADRSQVAEGKLRLCDVFSFYPDRPADFRVPLQPAAEHRQIFTPGVTPCLLGSLSFHGVPFFCQMQGGLHEEGVISGGAFPYPNIPNKPMCRVEGGAAATVAVRVAAAQGGVSTRAGASTAVAASSRGLPAPAPRRGVASAAAAAVTEDAGAGAAGPSVNALVMGAALLTPLMQPSYVPGSTTAPPIVDRLFAGAPGLPVCWLRRMDAAAAASGNGQEVVAYENLCTNQVEKELPTESEYIVTVPPSQLAEGALGIAFEPNFAGVERFGWRSGRRNSGYDAGAVVRGVRPGSYAARCLTKLRPGHHLIGVNGTSVLRMTFQPTMELLKNAGRPLVLRFHDPYAVPPPLASLVATQSAEALATIRGVGGAIPTVKVAGAALPGVAPGVFAAASPTLAGLPGAEGAAGSGSGAAGAGAAGAAAAKSGAGAGGKAPGGPPLPKRVTAEAQRTLDLALETMGKLDVHQPLKAGNAAADPEAARQAAMVCRALGDPGFLRGINAIMTGSATEMVPAAKKASRGNEAWDDDDGDEEDANAGSAAGVAPGEDEAKEVIVPMTTDNTARRAVELMASIVACDDPTLVHRSDPPAYDPATRPRLYERAKRMADLGLLRRALDAINSRPDPTYASSAVENVATIMRVYGLGGREAGLQPSTLTALQTALRKQEFTPAMAESGPIIEALAKDYEEQDGTTFIQKCIDATTKLLTMTEAGFTRAVIALPPPAGAPPEEQVLAMGVSHKGSPPAPVTAANIPAPVAQAMQSLVRLDRAARLIDDGSIVVAPEDLFPSMLAMLEAHREDGLVAGALTGALAKLAAHPINASVIVAQNGLALVSDVVALHLQTLPRVCEGAAAFFFNVGRDLDQSANLLEAQVVSRCCAVGRLYLDYQTNAGGTPLPGLLAPPGQAEELEEAVCFSGAERVVRDRNRVRARLVRTCINTLINLACWRNPDSSGTTSVDQIVQWGGIPLLGDTVRIHIADAAVVTSVLNCAANIAFKNRPVQLALGETMMDAVALAGYQYGSDVQLLSMALRTVGNLTNQDENIYRGLGLGIVRMMATAMMANDSNVPLANLTASVMSNIASVEPVDEDSAGAFKGTLDEAHAACLGHPSEKVRPSPADAKVLGALFASDRPPWVIAEWVLLEEGAVDALAHSMTLHSTDVTLVEACLRTLMCIVSEEAVAEAVVQRSDLVSKVLFVMRAADFDVNVQLSGATLIQMLAAQKNNLAAVQSSDAAHVLGMAMENHKASALAGLTAAATAIMQAGPEVTADPDALLAILSSHVEGRPSLAMQLLTRVYETYQLIAGPRAAKAVHELGIPGVTLAGVANGVTALAALSRRGLDINLPPSVSESLHAVLHFVHAGCVSLSQWLQPPVPFNLAPAAAAADPAFADMLAVRASLAGSDRALGTLCRALELGVQGSGQEGDPARPALQPTAARALVDVLAAFLMRSPVLPAHAAAVALGVQAAEGLTARPGMATAADPVAVDAFVRCGGLHLTGALLMAYATDAVQRAAVNPSPDTLQLTSRLLHAELLMCLDVAVGHSHPATLAALNDHVAAAGGSQDDFPLPAALGMVSATATAFASMIAQPGFTAADNCPSPLKLMDITDLGRRVVGHITARISDPAGASAGLGCPAIGAPGPAAVTVETEANAVFCFSVSRARQQMLNGYTARTAGGGAGLAGDGGVEVETSGAPSLHRHESAAALMESQQEAAGYGGDGGMTPEQMLLLQQQQQMALLQAQHQQAMAAQHAAAAAGGHAADAFGEGAPRGPPRSPGLRRGNSLRGILGAIAAEEGIEADYWEEGHKRVPVLLRALTGAAANAVYVYEAKAAKKALRAGKGRGDALSRPLDGVPIVAIIKAADFTSVRIGGMMTGGKSVKQSGLFKAGPKPERAVCLDAGGNTVFQFEAPGDEEADDLRQAFEAFANAG